MPALTASSISGERERQTLELMLTTTMEPRDMVLGKLASSLVTMLVLAVSALPVQALVFVYGALRCRTSGCCFVPRRCGNFNGQYRDLLFIGAAPLDGIDRLLLCDGGGADGGNDGGQSVCIPDGAPGGRFVCI
ncbi:MAG: ABC transporter permease [Clostridium fessum]